MSLYPDGHKPCATCGNTKSVEQFYFANKTTGRRQSSCIPCQNTRSNRWRANNPEARNRITRRRNLGLYGITPEQFDIMLMAQHGVCAICHRPPYGRGVHLAVDHDPRTGRVRGLLCTGCNNALGRFQDDPERLSRAIDYLGSDVDYRQAQTVPRHDDGTLDAVDSPRHPVLA